jgi:hypothetical protein
MGKLCEFLVLNIFMYSFIYAGIFLKPFNCFGIKAKVSALQQHNSNACIGLHNAPIHTLASLGAESEGRRPEEIFKFRVSEMPFPGLWGRFDRFLMVRKQRFSMSKFTI